MRQPQKKPTRKTRAELNAEGRERKRQKKHRGNASGSRANVSESSAKSSKTANAKDPRIGSKTPIDLFAETSTSATVSPSAKKVSKPQISPEKELETLENDDRLYALLERQDNGETLSNDEQDYVDTTLDRINALMVQLGIEFEEEPEDDEMLQAKLPDIVQLLKRKD